MTEIESLREENQRLKAQVVELNDKALPDLSKAYDNGYRDGSKARAEGASEIIEGLKAQVERLTTALEEIEQRKHVNCWECDGGESYRDMAREALGPESKEKE